MKKLIVMMFLGLAITNIGFAGYGEDMKGECVKGKDSGRDQEVVVSDSEVQTKEAKSTAKSK